MISQANLHNDDNRDWAAFAYVSGEMSEDERAQFEDELATAPLLCELVAEMTLLCVAIAGAADSSQCPAAPAVRLSAEKRRQEPPATRRFLAALVALCGCVVLFFAAVQLQPERPGNMADAGIRQDVESEIAEADVLVWAVAASEELSVEDLLSGPSEAQSLDVPDWMLAGVSLADFD